MADIVVQPKVFALFVAAGMLSCVVYALLRGLRGTKDRRMWTGLLDLVFIGVAILLFGVCSAYTLEGEIRLFALMAFVAGFAVFFAGPGAALSATVKRLIRFIERCVHRFGDALNRMLAKYRADE